MENKNNEKRAKFIKLAESRTNVIIKTIRLLANLSNKSIYTYTEADVKDIFSVIKKELDTTKSRFDNFGKDKGSEMFKLSIRK